MRDSLSRAALSLTLLAVSCFASAQNLLLNPSFETLGQANWTPAIFGPGAWQDSAASPPTTNGANGLTSSQGGPTSMYLYQDVVLPATGNYILRAKLGCDPQGLANTDFCRIDVTNTNAATIAATTPGADTLATTTTANVIATLYTRDGTAGPGAQGPVAVTFAGTAGQTVRVRILVQASNFFANVFADDFFLAFRPETAIPTLSEWGLILLALLLMAATGLHFRYGAARRALKVQDSARQV